MLRVAHRGREDLAIDGGVFNDLDLIVLAESAESLLEHSEGSQCGQWLVSRILLEGLSPALVDVGASADRANIAEKNLTYADLLVLVLAPGDTCVDYYVWAVGVGLDFEVFWLQVGVSFVNTFSYIPEGRFIDQMERSLRAESFCLIPLLGHDCFHWFVRLQAVQRRVQCEALNINSTREPLVDVLWHLVADKTTIDLSLLPAFSLWILVKLKHDLIR